MSEPNVEIPGTAVGVEVNGWAGRSMTKAPFLLIKP